MAKGGGSANKSFLVSGDQGVVESGFAARAFSRREDSRARHGGLPAVSLGRRRRRYVGRVRLEDREARLGAVSRRACRRAGSELGTRFSGSDDLEAEVHELTRASGIGAQFGGKYFCHDVRVVRLPRHGASCPVAIAVSCSADRQALGKITREGIFRRAARDRSREIPAGGHSRGARRRGRRDRFESSDGRTSERS